MFFYNEQAIFILSSLCSGKIKIERAKSKILILPLLYKKNYPSERFIKN
jgi:hypothetical protein